MSHKKLKKRVAELEATVLILEDRTALAMEYVKALRRIVQPPATPIYPNEVEHDGDLADTALKEHAERRKDVEALVDIASNTSELDVLCVARARIAAYEQDNE